MNSKAVLQVEGLCTHLYTDGGVVRAVDNVSLTVGRDEMVALVGESGCGKTMTALSIIRLEPSTARILSGSIYFDNRDILQLSREDLRAIRGKRIAMIYQDPMTFLNPILRVGNQVAEVIVLHQKVNKVKAWERVLEVFGVLRDIPERRRAGEALHESEATYRALVGRANDGIATIQDGILTYANARLAAILENPLEKILRTPFADHLRREHPHGPRHRHRPSRHPGRRLRALEGLLRCGAGLSRL